MELSIVVVKRFDSRGRSFLCTVGPFENGDAERWCGRYNAVLGSHERLPGAHVLPVLAPMDAAELAARQIMDPEEQYPVARVALVGTAQPSQAEIPLERGLPPVGVLDWELVLANR